MGLVEKRAREEGENEEEDNYEGEGMDRGAGEGRVITAS